jgi:sulfur carrier protein
MWGATQAPQAHRLSAWRESITLRCNIGGAIGVCDNAAMNIQLNGHDRAITLPCSLAQLLELEGLAGRRVAVELNGQIIPRARHADTALAEGDAVEIVHALGGG